MLKWANQNILENSRRNPTLYIRLHLRQLSFRSTLTLTATATAKPNKFFQIATVSNRNNGNWERTTLRQLHQEPRSNHPEGLVLAGSVLQQQLGRLWQPSRADVGRDQEFLGQVWRPAQESGEQERYFCQRVLIIVIIIIIIIIIYHCCSIIKVRFKNKGTYDSLSYPVVV